MERSIRVCFEFLAHNVLKAFKKFKRSLRTACCRIELRTCHFPKTDQ